MVIELKMRKQLREILENDQINPNIFVKVYDTSYSINIKIYQKNTEFGTELFVNVDLEPLNIPGISENYEKAIYDYIKNNVRVIYEYDSGVERNTVALRNFKAK